MITYVYYSLARSEKQFTVAIDAWRYVECENLVSYLRA